MKIIANTTRTTEYTVEITRDWILTHLKRDFPQLDGLAVSLEYNRNRLEAGFEFESGDLLVTAKKVAHQ
jgi:hypothetical protein